MEGMKRSPGYAESQIRLLLSDLKNSNNSIRLKAVKRFQDYINSYKPDMYDDDVDSLFTGEFEHVSWRGCGLLYYSGLDSDKHNGQLKRIASPSISLLKWLLTINYDDESQENIFHERFIRLSVPLIKKVNFTKHILNDTGNKIVATSRLGNSDDAFTLLEILMKDHRNDEGELDPIDVLDLLDNNSICRERFNQWLQKSSAEQISKTIEKFKSVKAKSFITINRPMTWQEVEFKPVPLQEDEEGGVEEEVETVELDIPISDPLNLSDIDLRDTQALYATGKLGLTKNLQSDVVASSSSKSRKSLHKRRMSKANIGGISSSQGNLFFSKLRRSQMSGESKKDSSALGEDSDGDDGNGYSDSSSDDDGNAYANSTAGTNWGLGRGNDEAGEDTNDFSTKPHNGNRNGSNNFGSKTKRSEMSILPRDKTFSPGIFLALVHGNISFEDLKTGLGNLKNLLDQQSNQRVSLVRSHFGLFVKCAEGLDWLKAYRKGIMKKLDTTSVTKVNPHRKMKPGETGDTKLTRAKKNLDVAKTEAQETLAPILDRMRRSRRLKGAEKFLRRLASTLEYPQRMRRASEKGDFNEVLALHQRILTIPTSSSLKILQRVKESAHEVINSVKGRCKTILIQPQPDPQVLLKHAKILRELEDDESYSEHLRRAFLKQCGHFADSVKKLNDGFNDDVIQCFLLGTGSSNSNVSNHSANNYSRESRRPSTGGIRKSSISKSSTARFSADLVENKDDGRGGPMDFEEDNDGGDDPGDSAGQGLLFGNINASENGDTSTRDNASTPLQSLATNSRLAHIIGLSDALVHWIPCLYRIAIEIETISNASMLNSGSIMGRSAVGLFSRGTMKPSKIIGILLEACAEVLRQSIFGLSHNPNNVFADMVSTVGRINKGTNTFEFANKPLSSNVSNNSNGSNSDTGGIDAEARNSQELGDDGINTTSGENGEDESIIEGVIAVPPYSSALSEPHQSNMVKEIGDLYETLESILTSSEEQIQQQAQSSNGVFFDSLSLLRELAVEGEVCIAQRVIDRYCTLVNELFDENILQRMTNQQIMRRNNALKILSSDFQFQQSNDANYNNYLNISNPNKNSRSGTSNNNNNASRNSKYQQNVELYSAGRIEVMSQNFEKLSLRCLEKLSKAIRRPDWVGSTVVMGFENAFTSFSEIIRREHTVAAMSSILNFASGSSGSGSISNDPATNHNRSQRPGRVSKTKGLASNSFDLAEKSNVGNIMDLKSLEQDLRGAVSSSKSNGTLVDINSSHTPQRGYDILYDILRSVAFLRTHTIPTLWAEVAAKYPSSSYEIRGRADSGIGSRMVRGESALNILKGNNNSGNNSSSGSGSLLSMLFSSTPSGDNSEQGSSSKNNSNPQGKKPTANSYNNDTTGTGSTKANSTFFARLIEISDSSKLPSQAVGILRDAANLEEIAFSELVKSKISEINSTVLASYRALVKTELSSKLHGVSKLDINKDNIQNTSNTSQLPAHLTKILLIIGYEKSQISSTFSNLTIETGFYDSRAIAMNGSSGGHINALNSRFRKSSLGSESGSVSGSSSGYGLESTSTGASSFYNRRIYRDNSRNEDLRLGGSLGLGEYSYQALPKGEKYGEYIFKEICHDLLLLYQDLVTRLSNNSFTSQVQQLIVTSSNQNQTMSNSSSSVQCPQALGRAVEEFEFLKIVICKVIPSHSQVQIQANIASLGHHHSGGSLYPSCDQLQREAKIYTVMILR